MKTLGVIIGGFFVLRDRQVLEPRIEGVQIGRIEARGMIHRS